MAAYCQRLTALRKEERVTDVRHAKLQERATTFIRPRRNQKGSALHLSLLVLLLLCAVLTSAAWQLR